MLPDFIARCLTRFTDRPGLSYSGPLFSDDAAAVSQQNQEHPLDQFLLTTMLLQSISAHASIHQVPVPWNTREACIPSISHHHILSITDQLYNLEQGDMPTIAYLHRARSLADQLVAAGRLITLSEFNIFVFKGLRPEFKHLAMTLAARMLPFSFLELQNLLLSHEFIHSDSLSRLTLPQATSSAAPMSADGGGIATGYGKGHPSHDHMPLTTVVTQPSHQLSNDYCFPTQTDNLSNNSSTFCQWPFESRPVLQQHHLGPPPMMSCPNNLVNRFHETRTSNHVTLDFQDRGNDQQVMGKNNYKEQHMKRDNKNHCSNNLTVKDDNSWINRDDFPEDFIFGTATSSYQFEGAAAQGGRGLGVWDVFTMETPDRIFDGSNGNIAVDMYNRYNEDIGMMKKMGFDACRISISWPRILPGGRCTGGINREGINYYNNLIDAFLDQGIEPYVTLFHWDLPYILEQEYDGFLSHKIVDDFRDFAELCFWEFGDRVKSWITLNEPWSYCTSGYVTGKFPPSKPAAPADKIANNMTTYRAIHDPKRTTPINHTSFNSKPNSDPARDAYTVAKYLLLAHATAVRSYRTKFQEHQEGKIGMVLCCQWYEPLDGNAEDDIAASRRAMDFMMGWFLEPVLTGRYPQSMTDFVPSPNLAQFSEEESEMLKGSIDFLGLNYYTANYVANDTHPNLEQAYYKDQRVSFHTEMDGKPIGPRGGSTWLYIVPWGVYKLLKHIKDTYKDIPPIYITENGVDEKNDCKLTAYDVCADSVRVKYHQDHLAYILKAMEEDVKIKGYFAWSYCDNFEWYEGYTVRFGLVYIDFTNNLARYPKSSAVWFANFLKKRERAKAREEKRLEQRVRVH